MTRIRFFMEKIMASKIELALVVSYSRKDKDHLVDKDVDKIIGKSHDSSGYCFHSGQRDLTYFFKDYENFRKALGNAKKSKKIDITQCFIIGWE